MLTQLKNLNLIQEGRKLKLTLEFLLAILTSAKKALEFMEFEN